LVVFDYAERVDSFTESHAPWSAIIFDYYLNYVPEFITQFSGLFTFIAVIFFTSKMAYQTEITAILSSGVSFRRLMWPYFISSMIIAMLSLGLNLWVIPVTSEKQVAFEALYLKKRQNIRYDRHIYRQIEPGLFAYVRGYSGRDNRATFFALEQYKGNQMVAMLEAAEVKFDPETRHWTAERYVTRTFDVAEGERFEKCTKLDTLVNLDATELGRVNELIKTMKIGRLNEFITQQKAKGSNMIGLLEVERHTRYSYPLATFILTLIGVSLSSRKIRGGMGLHIGVGITLCFTYILFGRFFEEFAKGGVMNPALAVWIPNMIYAAIAVYLYRNAPK
jgi:lipopolysaccharide export system permease protein